MNETGTTTGTQRSRVRVARERRGLTQVQLAERVGCHVLTVKRWEHGTHKPGTPELAQQLADVLEQPLESLFPPEEHAYVRDARARHPTTVTEIPDPRDVLATLRPSRPARPMRLASALALLATTATIAIAIAALSASRHDATPAPTPTFTPAVDAVDPPAAAERATISQAESKTTSGTERRSHVRRPIKRSHRRAATQHRHRAHARHRARRRSTQPTYPASAATSRVSQPASPTTPDGTRTQPVAATNTTAANAATATVQQSASSSANQAAVAPDGPSEFDGP